MIIIVDAHLPKSICLAFERQGLVAIHTSDLETGNLTPDRVIRDLANKEGGIVVTKDSDFYHSFVLKQGPPKLILVKIGNARLREVRDLFDKHAAELVGLLGKFNLIELYSTKLVAVE